MKPIFVTGIGTEIGKTYCSAVLTELYQADYWKPVQAGELDALDSDVVRNHCTNSKTKIHPEQFLLSEPMSPHAAARIDGIELNLEDFKIPETDNQLLIEGAGGLMVPINDKGDLIIDLIKHLDAEAILVSKNYLGSINHTLLSVEALKSRNIPIKGILFNGEENKETQKVIAEITGVEILGRVPWGEKEIV
ncbi:MAG: dethiobiotin synthase [Crocinitomicaceae bacterium]|nr:dethiobiotin synthase [Crocinitomicaceae bacterium]